MTSPHVQFKKFSFAKQKLVLEQAMRELGNPFPKKTKSKLKINVKIPHVKKSTTDFFQKIQKINVKNSLARKRNFLQTPFSHPIFKTRAKQFRVSKPLAFSFHFLFRRDQNHYNLTSKIMKMCEHTLKKTSPQYN